MTRVNVSPLLRFALRLDAIASLSVGALSVALARPLDGVVGAPPAWVLGAGLFMLGYGAVVGWLGTRPALPRWAVWTIVIGNALWALDSAVLAFSGWIAPGTLGLVLILAQAAVVALFAELQYLGLRRSAVAA